MYTDLSESLLVDCTDLLYAIIETPEDYNELVREWAKKSPEEGGIALRLQARLDQRRVAYNFDNSRQGQELIAHVLNLDRSIQPRSRLQKIKTAFENSHGQSKKDLLDVISDYFYVEEGDLDAILKSFAVCQKKDAEMAAQKGIPLKMDTLVEDHFTHEMSVKLHLDVIAHTTAEGDTWDKGMTDILWKELERAIPEVKPMILSWFADNQNIIGTEARCNLAKKLRSCDDGWLRGLPEYANAIYVFPCDLLF